jgi:glycosyltransferase involved in cell wall biosynthesis
LAVLASGYCDVSGMTGGAAKLMNSKLLFVLNDPAYFLLHWRTIALAAREAGVDVHIATPDGTAADKIRALGLKHHALPMSRSSRDIFQELVTLWAVGKLFRKLHPDTVHLLTIKPVIYGGIAARLLSVPAVTATITGLGFVFMQYGLPGGLLRGFVSWLYRFAFGHPNIKVIFLNRDDREIISRATLLAPEHSILSCAPGVDLASYAQTPLPEGLPVVVLAARLLADKGIVEFVDAARLLRQHGHQARFALVGTPDPGNPASLTEEEIAAWVAEGVVEHWGYRSDMPIVLASASLVVLPSYYREGLPRILMEAQACGRAVVTTDMPGCRDAITPGVTGLLVPPRDAVALADAMGQLIGDRNRLQYMGIAGRALAEKCFDVRQIVTEHLKIYRELLKKAGRWQ